MNQRELRELIAQSPMSRLQAIAVLLCVLTNVIDGFDHITMAFVAPALSKDWGLTHQAIGVVFSSVAVGMICGSALSSLADQVGRRAVILFGTGLVTVTTFLTGGAQDVTQLALLRLLTGLGVGAMVPCLNVMVIEFANRKWGNVSLSLVHLGLATGVMLCSSLAVFLTFNYGWRSFFVAAGCLNAVIFLINLAVLPESLEFLVVRQPRDALARINRVLARMGQPSLLSVPEVDGVAATRLSFREFARTAYLATTLLLGLAAFCHLFVSNFQNSWTPMILVGAGIATTTAVSSGLVMGAGSMLGNLLMGFLSTSFGVIRLTVVSFVLAALSLALFGMTKTEPALLLAVAGLCCVFNQAAYTGVYLVATRYFPTGVRATGVGLMVGIGRLGGMFGPYLGGLMMGLGWSRPDYFPILGVVSLVGAVAIVTISRFHSSRDIDALRLFRPRTLQAPFPVRSTTDKGPLTWHSTRTRSERRSGTARRF